MASLAPQVQPSFCAERQRLIEEFTAAVVIYLRVQSAQAQALIDGHGLQFDAEIKEARKQRDAARQAIIQHHRQHGC